MIIKVLSRLGGPPIEMDAAQIIVALDNGTPCMAACEYGPNGMVKIAHVNDADFNQVLRACGYGHVEIIAEHLSTRPPPPGAKLIAGPGFKIS